MSNDLKLQSQKSEKLKTIWELWIILKLYVESGSQKLCLKHTYLVEWIYVKTMLYLYLLILVNFDKDALKVKGNTAPIV